MVAIFEKKAYIRYIRVNEKLNNCVFNFVCVFSFLYLTPRFGMTVNHKIVFSKLKNYNKEKK